MDGRLSPSASLLRAPYGANNQCQNTLLNQLSLRLQSGLRHCLHWRSRQLFVRNCQQCIGMRSIRKLNWWCSLLELEPREQGLLPKNFQLRKSYRSSHIWHSGVWIGSGNRQEFLCLDFEMRTLGAPRWHFKILCNWSWSCPEQTITTTIFVQFSG